MFLHCTYPFLCTGLYTDERTNLNAPMLGMWDMNDRNTVKMVTESIAHLERKVVYIIPFSQLRVDTRYATALWHPFALSLMGVSLKLIITLSNLDDFTFL